ncbi:MAG: hypothetical protein ACRDGF_06575, partial [Chloroflexota bacterium]
PQHTTTAMLGSQIALTGWSGPAQLRAGHSATFHLYWRALTHLQRPYTVFLHLGTPSNDKLAQRDSWPWDSWFPTSEWAVGEQVDDPQTLTLPASLPAGTYRGVSGHRSLPRYRAAGGMAAAATAQPGSAPHSARRSALPAGVVHRL